MADGESGYRMSAETATMHRNALFAMSYDVPVMLTSHRGGVKGPLRVVERLSRQEWRAGTTVALKLEDGDVVHLADVRSIRSAR